MTVEMVCEKTPVYSFGLCLGMNMARDNSGDKGIHVVDEAIPISHAKKLSEIQNGRFFSDAVYSDVRID